MVLVVVLLLAASVRSWKSYEAEVRRGPIDGRVNNPVDLDLASFPPEQTPSCDASHIQVSHHCDPTLHHDAGCDLGGHAGFDVGHGGFDVGHH